MMIWMGFGYNNVGKSRSFVESEDLGTKRCHYLQERRSEKYRDAVFAYLDKPHCNQNQVNSKVSSLLVLRLFLCSSPILYSKRMPVLYAFAPSLGRCLILWWFIRTKASDTALFVLAMWVRWKGQFWFRPTKEVLTTPKYGSISTSAWIAHYRDLMIQLAI